jgi:hypothetical protein
MKTKEKQRGMSTYFRKPKLNSDGSYRKDDPSHRDYPDWREVGMPAVRKYLRDLKK